MDSAFFGHAILPQSYLNLTTVLPTSYLHLTAYLPGKMKVRQQEFPPSLTALLPQSYHGLTRKIEVRLSGKLPAS